MLLPTVQPVTVPATAPARPFQTRTGAAILTWSRGAQRSCRRPWLAGRRVPRGQARKGGCPSQFCGAAIFRESTIPICVKEGRRGSGVRELSYHPRQIHRISRTNRLRRSDYRHEMLTRHWTSPKGPPAHYCNLRATRIHETVGMLSSGRGLRWPRCAGQPGCSPRPPSTSRRRRRAPRTARKRS